MEIQKTLTVKELADILAIGRRQAYALVNSGKLHTIRVGTSIRIPKESVVNFLHGITAGETIDMEQDNDGRRKTYYRDR